MDSHLLASPCHNDGWKANGRSVRGQKQISMGETDSTYELKLEGLIDCKIEVNPFSSSVQLTRTETVTFEAHWMHAIQQNLIYTLSPCYVQIHWSSNDIKLMRFLGEQWSITILI